MTDRDARERLILTMINAFEGWVASDDALGRTGPRHYSWDAVVRDHAVACRELRAAYAALRRHTWQDVLDLAVKEITNGK
jgi:hypothetical protein